MSKEKRGYKKHGKKGKSRRVHNDDSYSSSKEDEEVNLCLMVKEESESNSVS